MKTSLAPARLDRSTARNCILVNQLATPVLGSLMAVRRLAGIGQLLVAVAGFLMVCGWFVLLAIGFYNAIVRDAPPKPVGSLGRAGAFTFGVAWLWSLSTSLQIYREFKDSEPTNVPPRLS